MGAEGSKSSNASSKHAWFTGEEKQILQSRVKELMANSEKLSVHQLKVSWHRVANAHVFVLRNLTWNVSYLIAIILITYIPKYCWLLFLISKVMTKIFYFRQMWPQGWERPLARTLLISWPAGEQRRATKQLMPPCLTRFPMMNWCFSWWKFSILIAVCR